MSKTAGEWYVSRGGERFGPVTFKDLIEAARAGRLEPRTDLLYGAELGTWTPAGDVDGVFERKEKPESAESRTGHAPPSGSLADSGSYDFGDKPTRLNLPGAKRLGYFLGVTLLPAIVFAGLGTLLPKVLESVPEEYATYAGWAAFLVVVAPAFVWCVVTVKRFQNLAMSGWWLLGMFVPLLSFWLQYRLFACPSGYAFTKKLDGIGKLLAVLYWLGILASFALPILVVTGKLGGTLDMDQLQEWVNQAKAQFPEVPQPKQ